MTLHALGSAQTLEVCIFMTTDITANKYLDAIASVRLHMSVCQVPFDDGISVSKGNEANGACK